MFSKKHTAGKSVERPFRAPKDSYTWLKYGQKDLAKTQLRRCYYRCAEHKREKCSAKRFVSFSVETPEDFHVKYCGSHNHGIPFPQGRSCTGSGDGIPEDEELNAQNSSLPSSPVMGGFYPPMSSPQNCSQSSQALPFSKRASDVSSELSVYWPDFSWADWDQICLESGFDSAFWNPSNCMSVQSSKVEDPMPSISQASFDEKLGWNHQARKDSSSLSEPIEAYLKSHCLQSKVVCAEGLRDNDLVLPICYDVIGAEKPSGSKSELKANSANRKQKKKFVVAISVNETRVEDN